MWLSEGSFNGEIILNYTGGPNEIMSLKEGDKRVKIRRKEKEKSDNGIRDRRNMRKGPQAK